MFRFLRLASGAAIFLALHLSPVFGQDTTRGREYTGPNGIVTLNVPKAPNWAGVPYEITALDTKGDRRYDKVMLHADDFGQFLVVGARVMPEPAAAAMDKDEPRTVLRNLSRASLMGWRVDLDALPDIADESFLDSKHGEAIFRVYRAEKGSALAKSRGRRPERDGTFDTYIASIVARRGPIVVFVLAQNDARPDDREAVVRMATEMFQDLRVAADR